MINRLWAIVLASIFSKFSKHLAAWVLLLGLTSGIARATTNTWIGGSGNFNDGTKWDTATQPNNGDDVVFTNATSYTVSFPTAPNMLDSSLFNGPGGTVTLNISAQTWTVTNLFSIGQSADTTTTVAQASGTLVVYSANGGATNTGAFVVGDNGQGTYILTNGSLTAQGIVVGNSSRGSGTLTISGSASFLNPGIPFDFTASGTITVGRSSGASNSTLIVSNSASITTGSIAVGGNANASNNTIQVAAGAFWEMAQRPLSVGGYASRMVVNNATINDAGTFLVGTTGGILDTAILTNGAHVTTGFGNPRVGNGNGTYGNSLIVAGGAILDCGDGGQKGMLIGASGSSSNNIILVSSGGMLTNAASITIGDASGTAGGDFNSLIINDGGKLFIGGVNVGNNANTTGNVFQVGGHGASAIVNVGTITMGSGSNLTFNNQMVVTNATLTCGSLRIGNSVTSASNTCFVQANTLCNFGGLDIQIGRTGASSNLMAVTSGVLTNVRAITVGLGNLGSGAFGNAFNITGSGALVTCASITVGSQTNDAFNTVSIASGSLICTSAVTVGANATTVSNSLVVTGGKVVLNSLRVRATNTLSFTAGTLNTAGTTIDTDANSGTGIVIGDGTSLASLELAAGGTGFHNFNDGLVITNNATLRGSGTLMGPIIIRGTLSPGFSSIATVTTSNDLVLGSSAVLAYDLGITGGNPIGDLTAVNGNLTLGGTVNVTDAGGFASGNYTLISYVGTLVNNGLAVGTLPGGFSGTISNDSVGKLVVLVVTSGAPVDPFTTWQNQYFGCTACAQAQGNADTLGKGMSNTNQFLAGFNPTIAAAYVHITGIVKTNGGSDVLVSYLGASGNSGTTPPMASRTNVLEFTTGTVNGSYSSNNFTSTGVSNILSGGIGLGTLTNMVDPGGATNKPSRFYRVRVLVP
jgi:fibronectin-binding autotransporter adhesin